MKDQNNEVVNICNNFLHRINNLSEEKRTIILNALLFAIEKHKDQFYDWKDSKKLPYAYHLICVAFNVNKFSPKDVEKILTGLWHDTLEDKKAGIEEIKTKLRGYSLDESIVDSLILLDRGKYKGKSKTKEYYDGILNDENALVVKSADLLANLQAGLTCFEYVIKDERRFLVYKYLGEIKTFLLSSQNFLKSKYHKQIQIELNKISSKLIKRFSNKNTREFNKALRRLRNE